jgi:chromate reductase
MAKKVAIIVGSLRAASLNRQMAITLMGFASELLKMEIVEIGQLPLYNQDSDDGNNPPAAWSIFRTHMKECDAVLFITPEYNRSTPGVIKNAIDVGSRPYGQSIWADKPCAIMTVSPGAIGGFGANHHLRQSLVFLNMPTMQQPEAYIGNAGTLFDPTGKIINEKTLEFLKGFMTSFATWVELHAKT